MNATSTAAVPRPCACTTVRKVSRRLARAYDGALSSAALNVHQLAVLRAVDRRDGEPMSEVARELSMDRTSLYRIVGTMQRRRWIVLGPGRSGRAKSVRITAEGRRALDEAAPGWERIQAAIVDRFGRRRWATLVADLEALVETVDAVEDAAGPTEPIRGTSA